MRRGCVEFYRQVVTGNIRLVSSDQDDLRRGDACSRRRSKCFGQVATGALGDMSPHGHQAAGCQRYHVDISEQARLLDQPTADALWFVRRSSGADEKEAVRLRGLVLLEGFLMTSEYHRGDARFRSSDFGLNFDFRFSLIVFCAARANLRSRFNKHSSLSSLLVLTRIDGVR